MQIQENIPLQQYNSFRIAATARRLGRFTHIDDLESMPVNLLDQPIFILGGGSNILLTRDFDGLVLKNEIPGIEVMEETEDEVLVRVGAGENWHRFVIHCIRHGYGGVENLSLIPGNTGASPMQNIGAYGVEIKDVFDRLEAYHIQDRVMQTFTRKDCGFGYRESVFKNRFKGQFIICQVYFRLKKKPVFNISYGAISQELERMGVTDLSLEAISNAVIRIRQSKLPDPAEIGNAGSFFKNPVISSDQFGELKQRFPDIPSYASGENVKLAAGWLIEQCGWKGYREGDAGCHARQALVLVNYGNATGQQILDLSEKILQSVKNTFGVVLEREVNII